MPETLLIPIYRVCGLLLLPVLLIAFSFRLDILHLPVSSKGYSLYLALHPRFCPLDTIS